MEKQGRCFIFIYFFSKLQCKNQQTSAVTQRDSVNILRGGRYPVVRAVTEMDPAAESLHSHEKTNDF